MKRNHVRPPEWRETSQTSQREDSVSPPPAKKILKSLLQQEVNKAIRELNEETPNLVNRREHRAASLIPEFDPESEDCTVTAWLRKIDQLGEIHGWDEKTKSFYLQDKLRGQAKKWYNRLEEYDYSWGQWNEMLLRAFPKHRDYGNMLDEMMQRKKLPTETMTKYYQDKVAMCFRCKLSDSASVSCVIRGLPQSLQPNAKAFQCDRPDELYEGFLSALDDYRTPVTELRPYAKDPNRQPFDKKNSSINPEIDPCPRCKKTGHTLRNCSQPDLRTCFKCGKQGHIAPRCLVSSSIVKQTNQESGSATKEIKLLQNYNSIYQKVVKVNGIYVKSYLDTGSQVNVLTTQVSDVLNLEKRSSSVILKGFSGGQTHSLGEVEFDLEIDGISLICRAHLTDVDMDGINLLIGQPVINGDGISLVVSKGSATIKQDPVFMDQADVVEECERFKVVTTSKECLPPGISIIKVHVLGNSKDNDVVTAPRHFELHGVSYSLPATVLRGVDGYIKVVNTGAKEVVWQPGEVLSRAESCVELSSNSQCFRMKETEGYNMKDGVLDGGEIALPHHNYSKVYLDILKQHKDKVALIDGITGVKITYNEIVKQSLNVAGALLEEGVSRGDVVAVCSENRIEYLVTVFAVVYIGAVANFINSAYSKDELIHTTAISKPKYMFCSPTTYEKYYDTIKSCGFVSKYFVYGVSIENATSFEKLVRRNVDVDSVKAANVDLSDTAIIVYSSGTTGLPKGVRWLHRNLIVSTLQPISTNQDLTVLGIAPWTNTIGFLMTMEYVSRGKTTVFLSKFTERLYLQTIEKYKVGFLLAVPPIVVLLSKSMLINDYDVSSVKQLCCGGAVIESKVIMEAKKRVSNLQHIFQGYGLSEITGALTMEFEDAYKLGSVGRVMPGVIAKVVDIESHKKLGPNQPGEVYVKGQALFGGYVGKDRGDDYDEDGFYKTGDVAYYDNDGYFYIVDRIKELIKYKSWQVPPSELEAVLLQYPAVKDAAVIGLPDPSVGELPLAFVVKQQGANVTEKEIQDFVASKVSSPKRLRGGVRFIEEIPKNGSGKILRRQLRRLLSKPHSKL